MSSRPGVRRPKGDDLALDFRPKCLTTLALIQLQSRLASYVATTDSPEPVSCEQILNSREFSFAITGCIIARRLTLLLPMPSRLRNSCCSLPRVGSTSVTWWFICWKSAFSLQKLVALVQSMCLRAYIFCSSSIHPLFMIELSNVLFPSILVTTRSSWAMMGRGAGQKCCIEVWGMLEEEANRFKYEVLPNRRRMTD